ncbi:MAG TPA: tetratricopeptide repeat protein, partial [Phycisphaerae bacterium]|nr:tetratricopeptide repeat protein [Phycisphaerae bacterium]
YQSAGELARDIRHYLANEPIEARRDSLRYVLRKQLRRHWVAVAIGASFLVLLAAGLITSMAFWYRAEQALVEKEQQRKLAEQRADETQRVADFQYRMLNEIDVAAMGRGLKDHFREQVRAGLARKYVGEAGDSRLRTSDEIEKELAGFDQLTSAAHAADVARRVMDEFVLQPAVRTVREFSDQPRVQAHILDGLGRTYRVLGLFDAAESNYRTALAIRRRALGDQHLALAVNLNNVATLLVDKGDAGAVEPLLNEALAILRRNSEADPALMASVLRNLAIIRYQARDFDAAESKCLEALSLARQLPEQPNGEVPACLNVLSGVWEVRGRHDEAIASSKEAVAILRTLPIPQRRDLSSSLQNLAFLLSAAGDMNGAENLYREAWAMKRQLHGDEHPDVATSLNSLAFFLKKKGDAAAAEPLYREAIAIQRKTIGDEHPDVGNTLNNLAALLRDKGDFEAAEPLYRESISIQEKQSPSDSVNLAVGRGGFARVLMGLCADESIAPELRKSRLAEAEALLLLARETFEKTSGVPAQLAQSNLESLVKLHELLDRLEPNQNHAAELAEWRRRLERFNAESK